MTGECRCGRLTSEEEFVSAEENDQPLPVSRFSVGAVSPSVSGLGSGGSSESTADEVAERLLRQTGIHEPEVSDDSCIDLVESPVVSWDRPGIGWVPRSFLEGGAVEDEELLRYIDCTQREETPEDEGEEEEESDDEPSVERALELFGDH